MAVKYGREKFGRAAFGRGSFGRGVSGKVAQLQAYPGLLFFKDFTRGSSVDADFAVGSPTGTFTRSNDATHHATYMDETGKIQLLGAGSSNVPRFSKGYYDGAGFHRWAGGQGLIVEDACTNLLKNGAADATTVVVSNNFQTPSGTNRWSPSVANDGAMTLSLPDPIDGIYYNSMKVEVTNPGTGGVNTDVRLITYATTNQFALASVTKYMVSFLVKCSASKTIGVVAERNADDSNLGLSATFDTVADTWIRVNLPFTTTTSTTSGSLRFLLGNNGTYTIQFDAISICARQVPDTFDPSITSSISRNAEKLTYATAGNRNAAEETIFIKFAPFGDFANDGVERYGSSSETKSRVIRKATTGSTFRVYPNLSDSSPVFTQATTVFLSNTPQVFSANMKHASPYAKVFVAGAPENSYTLGDWINPAWGTAFTIGSSFAGIGQLNGIIQSFVVYNRALTDAEVLAVTNILNGA